MILKACQRKVTTVTHPRIVLGSIMVLMHETKENPPASPNSPRPKSRSLYALLAACGLLVTVVALITPGFFDRLNSRTADEAMAVNKLRALVTLQNRFAAAHPEKGFTCELPLLRPLENQREDTLYDALHFLTTARNAGYKFVLDNCNIDARGVVVHYQATAVPIERGATGIRAFCTDDSGWLWYDEEGSATNCLASRRAIE
jgi:hypothetical protein